jgi:nucleoside-diphosphate-sugar epimerase
MIIVGKDKPGRSLAAKRGACHKVANKFGPAPATIGSTIALSYSLKFKHVGAGGMAPRIFITGAAGWVGGDFLALLQQERPDYLIRALVRSPEQARTLNSRFPGVHCVVASSELQGLLVAEGEAADVVVQIANSDDEDMTMALLEGVAKHPGSTYLHVTGTATLIDPSRPLGQVDPRIYSDVDHTAEILNFPPERLHAVIEQKIVHRAEALQAKCALVSLPVMFGKGRGANTPHSRVFEPYLRAVISHGRPFTVHNGLNVMSKAHVSDASSALLLLVDEALKGEASAASWGRDGYYFVETGESSFMDDAKELAEALHEKGFLESTQVDVLDEATVAKFWSMGPKFWGSNARCRAERLRALGWTPFGIKRKESLGEVIDEFFTQRQ